MGLILDASTLVLFNIYIIMGFQLGFNWNNTACNQDAYYSQLGFIVLMAIRLLFHELYHNRCINKVVAAIFNFILSGLLIALGIFFGLRVFNNPSDFYYNPDTLFGNEVCFQNRIVFVGEFAIIAFTALKDIYFVFCGGDREDTEVKPE